MTRRCKRSAVFSLLAVALSLLASGRVGATEFPCNIQNVHIVAEDSRDAILACEGAAAALSFLSAEGLDVATNITIEIAPSLTQEDGCSAAGHYLASSNKVVILPYPEFVRFKTWFRAPITHALYRSLVAHEVAHIVAIHNCQVENPTIQAQEYIAYVTTMATLEPAQRRLILSRYPGDGYETDQQMNATIYLCDPMRFGVEAYRHFLKKGREENYFRAILSGCALAE